MAVCLKTKVGKDFRHAKLHMSQSIEKFIFIVILYIYTKQYNIIVCS